MNSNSTTLFDDHLERHIDAYAPGVLNPAQHFQLVEELPKFCALAGVSQKHVTHSMLDCPMVGSEVDWMRRFNQHLGNGVYGAVFIGGDRVLDRMSAMVGCALRNYIHAKLVTVQSLVEQLKEGYTPKEDLLVISNFCLPKSQGGNTPSWQITMVVGMLMERFVSDKHTVVYTTSMADVKAQYGYAVATHIEDYFERIMGA